MAELEARVIERLFEEVSLSRKVGRRGESCAKVGVVSIALGFGVKKRLQVENQGRHKLQ
jgi:hypothetical protein